ncbi:MAG: hypothetical protein WCC64_17045, partial [Aliidongia sp.]
FQLDVTDRLPEERTYIEWLEKRLKHCFRLFRDSPVGRVMKKEMTQIREIIDLNQGGEDNRERRRCQCELFRILKGYFIEQIKLCPDELDCCLLREVECLCCPERDCGDWECEIRKCFCFLFELMLRYQYDCVMSELVFGCAEPEKACCVVLGTVEIVDGRLCRVCNIPRRHVWTFANLLPLAISTVLTGSLGGTPTGEGGKDNCEPPRRFECCPDYGPFDCEVFLREFETNVSARYDAAAAILQAAKASFDALTNGFAFTRADMHAPDIFIKEHTGDAMKSAERLNLIAERVDSHFPRLDLFQAFRSQMLLRPQDSVKFYPDADGKVRHVLGEQQSERKYEARVPETPDDVNIAEPGDVSGTGEHPQPAHPQTRRTGRGPQTKRRPVKKGR